MPEVTPRIVSTEEYHVVDFTKEQIIFLITSTQGDGTPPSTITFRHFGQLISSLVKTSESDPLLKDGNTHW